MDTAIVMTTDAELLIDRPLPADRHPAAVYLVGLGGGSRRTMRHALDTIAETMGAPDAAAVDWARLRYQHVAAIRARLAEEYAPATVNKMLSALRGVARACWRLGQMTAEDYQRVADVEGVRGETLPRGRRISAGELRALMQVCEADPSPAGVRDAAMMALLYAGGLRRAELVTLDIEDLDPAEGALRVKGKGNKERLAYVGGGVRDALEDWLAIRGNNSGALFWAIDKGGNLHPGRLTTQAVYNLLRKRAKEAGVKPLSPHDFRRTFVSDLLDAGADIATVQKLAGHANVTTTTRYDRRGEETKRRAVELLHVPYKRRRMM